MRAVVLAAAGGPEQLHLRTLPDPVPGPDDVLVRVRACGVAHRDLIERRSAPLGMVLPIVQGHEFAGEVAAVGANVTEWSVGDRVLNLYTAACGQCEACRAGEPRRCQAITEAYGLTVNGGYAELVRVHRSALVRLIDGIAWPVAATLMSALGVGYNNVVHKARVRPGEHVLVTGASGGVGLAALQAAKLRGAHVWAVTGSAAKEDRLRAMGADEVIVDDGTTIHKQVRGKRRQGVDAAIDCVGSPTLNGTLRAVRPYGRVVAIGNVDPAPLQLNVGLLVVGAIDLLGSDNVTLEALAELMPLVRDGTLAATIDETIPLDRVADAHRRLEAREAFGRIVINLSLPTTEFTQ
ncbi:alcohol dehydrogenase catalytic domain-containing protein [Sphingomonas jatrophae]|uniref:alcohol dehydrogenase n=1 Tax=Sphingomonas jatrophae TaxID=1166337 RepID=A0A1I6KF45_9SPHN|nr:alcohol dehydrogenase catalytic domain-containing protein [Sphingomonas jatrophae]SFR89859.1 D-arabinose 1-dehydrogenase, Zn-dependent alcohol dehydrogenase family [Sphingomonas jatrophae]